MTMNERGAYTRDVNSDKFDYVLPWDAKSIAGCVCDDGYFGSDCSSKMCPDGDDPLTTGQVYEKQIIKCMGTPELVPGYKEDKNGAVTTDMYSGYLTLMYKGHYSGNISPGAGPSDVKKALEIIPGIGTVKVEFSTGATTLCAESYSNAAR